MLLFRLLFSVYMPNNDNWPGILIFFVVLKEILAVINFYDDTNIITWGMSMVILVDRLVTFASYSSWIMKTWFSTILSSHEAFTYEWTQGTRSCINPFYCQRICIWSRQLCPKLKRIESVYGDSESLIGSDFETIFHQSKRGSRGISSVSAGVLINLVPERRAIRFWS